MSTETMQQGLRDDLIITVCGIVPTAEHLIVRRCEIGAKGDIVSPGSELGTECEIMAIPFPQCGYALGDRIFVARSLGVPVGGEEDADLWFVANEDVLGYRPEINDRGNR